MKLKVQVISRIRDKEFSDAMEQAAKKILKNIVIDIGNDSVKDSPFDTGNNRRSIAIQINRGVGLTVEENRSTTGLDIEKFQAAVFSTSGYGGFLETGTRRMRARPYMNPARERHFNEARFARDLDRELRKGF